MSARPNTLHLLIVLLGLPMIFLIDLQVSYSLMELVCTTGRTWPLHLSSIISLTLLGAGAAIAWRGWTSSRHSDPDDDARLRARFLGGGGVAFGILFALCELSLVVTKVFLVRCS